MKNAQILRFFWLGFAIHFGVTLSCLFCPQLEPTQNIRLTTQSDAVLIYGQNQLGSSSIRVFKNWENMQAYLAFRKLELPKLSYAEKGYDVQATLEKSAFSKRHSYYRIFWTQPQNSSTSPLSTFLNTSLESSANGAQTSSLPAKKLVLHTPDPESALQMLQYVKFLGLTPSMMGYSVPLEFQKESSI